MSRLIKLFRRQETPSFPGVLVPLQQVQRYQIIDATPDPGSEVEVERPEGTKPSEEPADEDDQPLLHSDSPSLTRLKSEIEKDIPLKRQSDPYEWKSRAINKAIEDMGIGRYQMQLFVLCGMGWLADNLWMQGLALVLPRMSVDFGVDENTIRYTTLITYVGLSIGSTSWGVASDIIGRRPAFNMTLLLCGVFGFGTSLGPNWAGTAALFLCMAIGVGGNLPVDGALFLEFLPTSSNSLLTLLSVWWPVGQLVASLVAWAVIPTFSCDAKLQACALTDGKQPCCASVDNRGWRYFLGILGLMTLTMFICRFFLFHLYESPKFLLSQGRQREAVAVVHGVAWRNSTRTWLTEDILNAVGGHLDAEEAEGGAVAILSRRSNTFSWDVLKPLFRGWKLAVTTVLIWLIWGLIGMAYPLFNAFLPQYLARAGADNAPVATNTVYRNYLITSAAGVPGSILAWWTVDIKYLGRKGTMAISTLASAIFVYMFTLSTTSTFQTFCSSMGSFFQNIMYGVLYAYTPEVFPAPSRGTGNGIASLLNRITGILAPVVAANQGAEHPSRPIVAAGVLYLISFLAMILLPIETRGQQSL